MEVNSIEQMSAVYRPQSQVQKYNWLDSVSEEVLLWLDGRWVWSSGADMDATAPVEADLKLVREEDQYQQEQIERMMGIPGISLK